MSICPYIINWKRGGEGFSRRSKRRRHLPRIQTFTKFVQIFFGQTDRPTDRQTGRLTDRPTDRLTDIVVHREVTLQKVIHKLRLRNRDKQILFLSYICTYRT